MKRKHERTAPGNPRELTIRQHVHSDWCISKFTDGEGGVSVLRRAKPEPFHVSPDDDIFCAMRVWDQQAEEGFFLKIENAFHAEVDHVLNYGSVQDHEAVSEYFAVWEVRAQFKENPPADIEVIGISEPPLTKEQEEVLERKWGKFFRGNTVPGRFMADIRAIRMIDEFMSRFRGTRWGVARTDSVPGFICPDRPASQAYIPIDRKHALVGNWPDMKIDGAAVAKLNRESWEQSRNFVFGHRDDVSAFLADTLRT